MSKSVNLDLAWAEVPSLWLSAVVTVHRTLLDQRLQCVYPVCADVLTCSRCLMDTGGPPMWLCWSRRAVWKNCGNDEVTVTLVYLKTKNTRGTSCRCVLMWWGEGWVPVLKERHGVLHEEYTVGIGSSWFLGCPVHPRPSPATLLLERVYHLYPTCARHDTRVRCTCTVNSLLGLTCALC